MFAHPGRSWLVAWSLLAIVAGCSSGADGIEHLAAGSTPASLSNTPSWIDASGQGQALHLEEGVPWLESAISPDQWKPSRWEGLFECVRPIAADSSTHHGADFAVLLNGERSYALVELPEDPGADESVPEGSFALRAKRVYVWAALKPTTSLTLRIPLDLGEKRNDSWRVTSSGTTANGVPLWTGSEQVFEIDARGESDLAFGTLMRSFDAAAGEAFRLRVSLGQRELFSFEPTEANELRTCWHRVALPDSGSGELCFSLEGPPGLGVLLTPRIVPRQRIRDDRPDIVLFIADTLRADALHTFGGEPGVTPGLDRFASESMVMECAWSVAGWTLPAHATMFSGLLPPQHVANTPGATLPEDAVTIAEWLHMRGYRTGAVTDSGFVTQKFGLDQGFEWFEEHTELSLVETLDSSRRFLEDEDGRPTFLVVHTFRVHNPYRTGREESRELWRSLIKLLAQELAELGTGSSIERRRAQEDRAGKLLRELYLEGVRGLDTEVGAFFDELESSGWFGENILCFTSDHGEAFFEHGVQGHGEVLWEEVARVPLLFRGASIGAGRVPFAASHLDFARTFAELAGVPAFDDWEGRSLISLIEDRPASSFAYRKGQHSVAVVENGRRVHFNGLGDGEGVAEIVTFDLDVDPRELHPLPGSSPDTSAQLERVRAAIEPRLTPGTVELSAAVREQLKALGYLGDE